MLKMLKQELERKDITVSEVALRTGFSRTHMSQMLNGKALLTDENAIKILTSGIGYTIKEAKDILAQWRIEKYKEDLIDPMDLEPLEGGFRKVPVLGSVSCGPPSDTDTHDYEAMPTRDLDPKKDYWILRANGHSMSPEIPHGAKIVIERTQEFRGPTKIYLFRIGGDEYGIGRIAKTSTHWEVSKSNKEYPSIPIDSEDGVDICGIVALIIHKL